MKIEGNSQVSGKELFNRINDLGKNQEAEKKADTQDTGTKDKISLSARTKEIDELRALIRDLPDIRTDRVEEIKKAVDAGSYNIDSLKVAEKVLEEI